MILCLIIGIALGVATFYFPFTRFIFSYLTILIHEFGHAFFAWIYGSPALPAFDFTYGGGVTAHFAQRKEIYYCTFALLIYGLWFLRHNLIPLICNILFLIIFCLTFNNDWADIIRIYMGHGTEIAIAGIFLYRGLTGSQSENLAEQTIYFATAFFIFCQNIDFAYHLQNDVQFLFEYKQGKGDITHDFHKLSRDHFHDSSIKQVANIHYLMILFSLVASSALATLRCHLIRQEFDDD